MDESYAEVGTKVILGKHKRYTSRSRDWCNMCMAIYVGREAVIQNIRVASDQCVICKVTISGAEVPHWWRAEDMILASDVPLLTPEKKRKLGIKDGRS
jgi:hypothetical protein